MALEKELEFFAENKTQWAEAHWGKFVLVKGSELLGVYDNAETAIAEGAKRVGAESFWSGGWIWRRRTFTFRLSL